MNILKMISQLKKKTVEPKYYSLVLRCSTIDFLEWTHIWSGIEYSLERAMGKAKKEIIDKAEKRLNGVMIDVKFELWTITPIKKIINESCDTNFKETEVDEIEKTENKTENKKTEKLIKNEMIKEIIKNKDAKLFEKNRENFTLAEIKLIVDSLKK